MDRGMPFFIMFICSKQMFPAGEKELKVESQKLPSNVLINSRSNSTFSNHLQPFQGRIKGLIYLMQSW